VAIVTCANFGIRNSNSYHYNDDILVVFTANGNYNANCIFPSSRFRIMKRIGITGTRSGMNEKQEGELRALLLLEYMRYYHEPHMLAFHHGDCIGVDVQAAIIARGLGFWTVSHPPIKTELRAFHRSDDVKIAKGYFARNRDIVDAADEIIVVPYQNSHQNNGGTWYTHDYAKKLGKLITIIWPG
jgi:hypothetical protein